MQVDCPLCVEPLGLDEQILPCPCGYQVCMFCWHRVKEEGSGNCPACRLPYSDTYALAKVTPPTASAPGPKKVLAHPRSNVIKSASSPQLSSPPPPPLLNSHHHRPGSFASRGRGGGGGGGGPRLSGAGAPSSTTTLPVVESRDSLRGVSVFQKNLVVLSGLPASLSNESTLRRPELCGQFCTNSQPKVLICGDESYNMGRFGIETKGEGKVALVWFSNESEARACVIAVDGFRIGDSVIRCSIGTIEYCETFLKNEPSCVRQGTSCYKLHSIGPRSDSFTKSEKASGFNEVGSSFAELRHPNLHFKNGNGVIGDNEAKHPVFVDKTCSKGGAKLAFPCVPPHLIGYARGTVPLPSGLSLQRPVPTSDVSEAEATIQRRPTSPTSTPLSSSSSTSSPLNKQRDKKGAQQISQSAKPFLAAAMRSAQPLKPLPAPKKQHEDIPKAGELNVQPKKSILMSASEAAAALSAALAAGVETPAEEAKLSSTESVLDDTPLINNDGALHPSPPFQRSRRGKRGNGRMRRAAAAAAAASGGEKDNINKGSV